MSTIWYPLRRLPFDTFQRAEPPAGCRWHTPDPPAEGESLCLTDGRAYLWCHRTPAGGTMFEACGSNQGGPDGGPDFRIRRSLETRWGLRLVSDIGPFGLWNLDVIAQREFPTGANGDGSHAEPRIERLQLTVLRA